MREIKFRAFIKQTNEVFPVMTIWSNSICLDLTGSDREWNAQVFNKEDVELLQYTGLKDKDGKEIYEGDILQPYNRENKFYPVIWHDTGFVLEYKFNIRGYDEINRFPIHKNSYIIVGNIYENNELIQS